MPMAVVVGEFPSLSETFILRELDALDDAGLAPVVYALRRSSPPALHAGAQRRLPEVRFVEPATTAGAVAAAWRDLSRGHQRLAMRWSQRFLAAGCRFPRMTVRCVRHLPAIAALGVAGRDRQFNYMHAHFATLPAEITWAASLYNGCPFVISTHARDLFTQSPALLGFKIRAADLITGCTATHVRYLKELASPDVGSRVELVYHGVEIPGDEPVPTPESGKILAIGRLVPKKAFDILIAACAILTSRKLDYCCELVGEGPQRAQLEKQIQACKLNDRIRLAGAYSREAMPIAWQSAVLAVITTRVMPDGDRDGIPNVLLEAMAQRIPVIAVDTPSIREVIRHNVNGWLVKPDDPADLAAAIANLLQDPGLRHQLAETAFATVRNDFDATVHAKKWTARLKGKVEREGPRSSTA